MTEQSDNYKASMNVDYLGGMPGTEREEDRLRVVLTEALSQLDVDLTAQTLDEVITDVSAALKSDGSDSLLVQEDTPLDASGAPVPVEDTQGSQVNPATEESLSALADALASVAQDSVRVASGDSPVNVDIAEQSQTVRVASGDSPVNVDIAEQSQTPIQVVTQESVAQFQAPDHTVPAGNVYDVPAGETWRVNNLTVNGRLYVEGTLVHYGRIDGSGVITGAGAVRSKE